MHCIIISLPETKPLMIYRHQLLLTFLSFISVNMLDPCEYGPNQSYNFVNMLDPCEYDKNQSDHSVNMLTTCEYDRNHTLYEIIYIEIIPLSLIRRQP